jgi:hypothetical protein
VRRLPLTDVHPRVRAPQHHAHAVVGVVRDVQLRARDRLAAAFAVYSNGALSLHDQCHDRCISSSRGRFFAWCRGVFVRGGPLVLCYSHGAAHRHLRHLGRAKWCVVAREGARGGFDCTNNSFLSFIFHKKVKNQKFPKPKNSSTMAEADWAVDLPSEVWALVAAHRGIVGACQLMRVCKDAHAGGKEYLRTLPGLAVCGGISGEDLGFGGEVRDALRLDLATMRGSPRPRS